MATHDDVPMNPEYMDYAEHERTYSGFITVTKWGVVAVAGLLVVLMFFIL
ncbi:aa3-type cytochrome c oxidase subunit IV [Lichenibacterium minor]|jgi:hypothetical protein|uniref:Aa3-type cytochrome c oxidase subunit IV n=1 Tax=Lichenibacterium minor TaxID=2316528 RepID=A0A4Q2UAF4_9HYPH|nr:aa3-type cytochrome c oxidase subunit IV [Lichenibacterium minor]RYC32087.1 aa3-type cytochrome c oxidase subunit IV [Lichenibacterium minor]